MNEQQTEQAIIDAGKTAPRITPADLDAAIDRVYYFTAKQGALAEIGSDGVPPTAYETAMAAPLGLLTFCVIVLINGFTVTGESACASPENFDAQIGRDIAYQAAREKLWPLLGYQLKDKLHRDAQFGTKEAAS